MAADRGHPLAKIRNVYLRLMSPANDNQVATTAATPHEGVVPGLSRQARPRDATTSRQNVLDTLLGKNNLAAIDAGGSDPYNATGRQFRR
jgi:hypothetical protein